MSPDERFERYVEAMNDVIVTHRMWIGDNGRPLKYLPEREARITEFLHEAAAALVSTEGAS